MAKKMLIDATHKEETRVVVVDGNKLDEFDFESINKKQLAGNIYLAKVMRVEPSLQAAFVDYGGNRHGFLAFSEIHPDYYQIPKADREALLAAQARERAEEEDDEDGEDRPKSRRRSSRSGSPRSESSDKRRGSRRGGRNRRSGGGHSGPKKTRDGDIIEREFRISGGVKVRLTRPDDGTENEITLDDGTPVKLSKILDAPTKDGDNSTKTMASTSDLDEKISEDAEDAADAPEQIGGEDVREEVRPPRKPRLRDYKIQDVIKKKQILLIQVVKEERGSKGAAVTTYLSLAGRYCVLMPNTARGGGISRKITQASDRKKLKDIAGELEVPKGMGLIIRTAGAERTRAEIKRDYEYLLRQWEAVRDLTLESFAPALTYEEGSLIKRSIRDLYTKDIDEIQVEGEDGYREAKDYMKMLTPSHAKNVQPYRDQTPLFIRHQVENHLAAMFNPTVQLKSGGYIVIGITEALVAIDVNSGRSTRERSIEDTAVNTNLEAAEEVARQLRLRDLAGLIVIDFIDMDRSSNNRAVEKKLKDKLATDRARLQIGRISSFGLLEMSRQRLRPGMLEASTKPCPHCHGEGLVRSDESLALTILRDIEEEGVRQRSAVVVVKAPVDISNFLLNHKRDRILSIEDRYNLRIVIEGDPHLISPEYKLEKMKEDEAPESLRRLKPAVVAAPVFMDDEDDEPIEDVSYDEDEATEKPAAKADDDGKSRRRGNRGGRRRRKPEDGDPLPVIDLDGETDGEKPFSYTETDDAKESGTTAKDERGGKRRRSRGGRNRSERGKMNGRELGEAAATSMLSGRDALDDALPELFKGAPVEAEGEPQADAATLKPIGEIVEPPFETDHDASVEIAEVKNSETELKVEPEIATEPELEPLPKTMSFEPVAPTPPKTGPKKRGWWSRNKSAS